MDKALLLPHKTRRMNCHGKEGGRRRYGYFKNSKYIVTEVKVVVTFGRKRLAGGVAERMEQYSNY